MYDFKENINEATLIINTNPDFLINHATDQLFYLDELYNTLINTTSFLENETYNNIVSLEFETKLLIKAMELNPENIVIDSSKLDVIKYNCDDLLEKIGKIKPIHMERFQKFFFDFGEC